MSTDRLTFLRRLLNYARPYLGHMILGIICMVCVAALSAATAKMMKPIINDIFIKKNQDLLWPITFGVIGLFFFKGLFSYGESVIMAFVGHKIIAALQRTLYVQLIQSDLSLFQRYQSGDLVSRFVNDISKLNNAITGTVSNIGKDFLTLVFFIMVMVSEDAHLSIVMFFIVPVAIFPIAKIGRWIRKAARRLQEQTAGLTVLLTQDFQGIRLIKSYLMEHYQIQKANQVITQMFNLTYKSVRIKSVTHPIMEFLGGIAIAAVIMYGGQQVIMGEQTPGAFFAFITALIMSYEPMKRLANLHANMQEQMAAAERVFTLIDYQNKVINHPHAESHIIHKGKIAFKKVWFHYHLGRPILKNISLTIPAGSKVALVGPSGGGKSSLIHLLPRFYDVASGNILIDDIRINQFTLHDLRSQIAMVSQEIVLFDDTIENNILYGKPEANENDIIEAAKAAAAHDFIMELPQGYQTKVGEQGMSLSGGQRQRLSIARAMLKNAPILLLDEPTSALDSDSEMIVQQALNTLMKDKTTLIIAHRLATVRDADIIYVIDQGQVVASGNHQELLKKSPLYAQLSHAQFSLA